MRTHHSLIFARPASIFFSRSACAASSSFPSSMLISSSKGAAGSCGPVASAVIVSDSDGAGRVSDAVPSTARLEASCSWVHLTGSDVRRMSKEGKWTPCVVKRFQFGWIPAKGAVIGVLPAYPDLQRQKLTFRHLASEADY